MSPLTHFVASWLVATATTDNPRDRRLITLAGITPDADGLGLVADIAISVVSGKPNEFYFYQNYHHYLMHGWPGALVTAILFGCFAKNRFRTAALCLLTFHLHLLCDLIGSRGPTLGDIWPICYSEPIWRHPTWIWKGQWRLDGWQNRLIFVGVFATALWVAVRRGYSFMEVFSAKADAVFVRVLRKWSSGLVRNDG